MVAMLVLAACDEDDDGKTSSDSADDDGGSSGDDGTPTTMTPGDEGSGGDDGPPMWVVGEEGQMLRVDDSGAADRYPLDVEHDFYGIACRGDAEAWVVGASGTLLSTRDAGLTWDEVALDTTADLTAVAAADAGPIWAVGDGVAFASSIEGDDFAPADVPAREYTAVAVAPHGAYALLADASGRIWRAAAAEPAEVVWSDAAPLRGVSIGGHGTVAVAVGELGTVLRSDDAGETFVPVAISTAEDLHAVVVADSGALVVAVGASGTIVRIHDEEGTSVQGLLDPALTLRAVHLAGGQGHALGDAGVMLQTHDAGATWTPAVLPTDVTLHGLDHPGVPHD